MAGKKSGKGAVKKVKASRNAKKKAGKKTGKKAVKKAAKKVKAKKTVVKKPVRKRTLRFKPKVMKKPEKAAWKGFETKTAENPVMRESPELKETMIYRKTGEKVLCGICGQGCELGPNQKGFCGVRKNIGGKLYSLVYGRAIDVAVDPIEKKPFFHFAPGSRALSVATVGCNLGCLFCQNWQISQKFGEINGMAYSPKDLVTKARNWKCQGLAYTYTEPAVFYEYVYDTAKEAETDFYNVIVTNGYFTPEAVKRLSGYIDAANVDLKGDYRFYAKYCLGKRGDGPVKDTLLALKERGVWTEITNLLIPGLNDSVTQIRNLCSWILDNLGEEVPLHFSKFYPTYKLNDIAPTPVGTLEKARELAREAGLKYVYVGNVPGHKYESTFCQGCGNVAIKRSGLSIEEFRLDRNFRCLKCGEKVPIGGKNWIDRGLFRK